MKNNLKLLKLSLLMMALFSLTFCSKPEKEENNENVEDIENVEYNIKRYTHIWDEILNKRNLDMFNDSNFTRDVIMHDGPTIINGIDSAKALYSNYVNGFTEIEFTVNDIFGQDNKLVKHWTFKGIHSGDFFGIPPTGRTLNIEGVTLVRMKDGKIAEERDFMDNLDFNKQLGLIPEE